jgi:hypothetical protein
MIAATFHGPNHFLPNHDESTIEVFENIGHAISALFDRYESHGDRNLEVRYLNGGKWRVPFPHVEKGDSFECYKIESLDGSVPPGDDAIEEALTGVHTGLWDYRLVLRLADDRSVYVTVEKR